MTTAPRPVVPSSALFLALLAITLNFLQPLAHAALMRDGVLGGSWSAWCKSAAAEPDKPTESQRGAPPPTTAGGMHDCCLGLAHAPSFVAPSATFVVLPPTVAAAPVPLPAAQRPSIAIRDGPPRPRGPPSSPMT